MTVMWHFWSHHKSNYFMWPWSHFFQCNASGLLLDLHIWSALHIALWIILYNSISKVIILIKSPPHTSQRFPLLCSTTRVAYKLWQRLMMLWCRPILVSEEMRLGRKTLTFRAGIMNRFFSLCDWWTLLFFLFFFFCQLDQPHPLQAIKRHTYSKNHTRVKLRNKPCTWSVLTYITLSINHMTAGNMFF